MVFDTNTWYRHDRKLCSIKLFLCCPFFTHVVALFLLNYRRHLSFQLFMPRVSVRPSRFKLNLLAFGRSQEPMYGTRPCCLVHTRPDPHLGSWNCLPHQAHIAPSEPMSSIDQQGSSLDSFPTFPPPYPYFNRPSGFWPCVKSCLVGGSDKLSSPSNEPGRQKGLILFSPGVSGQQSPTTPLPVCPLAATMWNVTIICT